MESELLGVYLLIFGIVEQRFNILRGQPSFLKLPKSMYTKRLRDKYALQMYGGFTIRLVVEVHPVLECYLHTMKFTKHWFKDHRRFVTLGFDQAVLYN